MLQLDSEADTTLQESIIRRVDPGLGVLLELRPNTAADAAPPQQSGKLAGGAEPVLAGYAHISAVSDKRIEKLEKVRAAPAFHPLLQISAGISPQLSASLPCTAQRWHGAHEMDPEACSTWG